MRNRLLTVICILSLAFGLVACGNEEDVKDTSAPSIETETNAVESETSTQEETTEVVKDETESETTPASEENDAEIVASGKLSDASIEWKIIGTTLYVSGTGAIPDFSTDPGVVEAHPHVYSAEDLRDWQTYYKIVEKVVIEDGITKIGQNNFANFVNAKEIVFADSVNEIGKWGCRNMGLDTINFNKVTKLGFNCFGCLLNLTSVRIPGTIKTVSEGCFVFCENLKEVYIENGVEVIDELAFSDVPAGCKFYIAESVITIIDDALNDYSVVYVKAGSKAEEIVNGFADRYNITVIAE